MKYNSNILHITSLTKLHSRVNGANFLYLEWLVNLFLYGVRNSKRRFVFLLLLFSWFDSTFSYGEKYKFSLNSEPLPKMFQFFCFVTQIVTNQTVSSITMIQNMAPLYTNGDSPIVRGSKKAG